MQKIQQTKSGLVAYIKTDSAAQALSDSLSKISDIKVKYQKEKFMAVAKFVPPGTTLEEIIAGNPNVTETKRYGTSQTVRLAFADASSRDRAIRQGIYVEYTHLKVTAFKEIPKRCFKCQSFEHLARECSNQPCCPRCAGPHESTREAPCQSNSVKCALCPNGKNEHPSYSLFCPAVRKAMNKAPQLRK